MDREFSDAPAATSVVQEAVLRPHVLVLRSLGKSFGLHGVRFGYLVANPALAGRIRSVLPKWNLNSFAEAVVFMLGEHHQEYEESLRRSRRDRLEMAARLSALPGLTVYPSQGNFLYVRLPVGVDGAALRDRLLTEHAVLVRECGNKVGSSSRFLRLVVRPPHDVGQLIGALERTLYGDPARPAPAPLAAPAEALRAPGPGAPHGLEPVPASAPVPASRRLPEQTRPLTPAHTRTRAQAMAPAPVRPRSAAPAAEPMAMARGYTSSGTAAVGRLVSG